MKTLKLITLLLVALSINAFAQEKSYSLDSYVNPTYKRQSLDFDLNTNDTIGSRKINTSFWDEDRESQGYSGNLNVEYRLVNNSERVQRTLRSGMGLNGHFSRSEDSDKFDMRKDKSDQMTKNFGYNFYLNDRGYYYCGDKKFIEFSPSGSFQIGGNRYQSNDNIDQSIYSSETYSKDITATASFRLGIGKGRIEQVGDARQAMYILTDLLNNGTLKRVLNQDEVNAFARQMTSIKNKRQFDSRIKLIEEITTVDSFLVANDYIDPTNTAKYFTSLYDNWMYAGLIERGAGSRISIGLTPYYSFNQLTRKDTYIPNPNNNWNFQYINSEVNGAAYAYYEYEKPVNLTWQHSAYAEVKETWGQIRDMDGNYTRTDLMGSFGMGYYPNTRTYATGTLYQQLTYHGFKSSESFGSYSNFNLSMYYYLSPQLRLFASGNINYYYSADKRSGDITLFYGKYPGTNFSLGLKYSIF